MLARHKLEVISLAEGHLELAVENEATFAKRYLKINQAWHFLLLQNWWWQIIFDMIIEVDLEDFLTDVVEHILKEALLRTAQVNLTNKSMFNAAFLDPKAYRSELIFCVRPRVKLDQIVPVNDVLLPVRDDLDEDLVFPKR